MLKGDTLETPGRSATLYEPVWILIADSEGASAGEALKIVNRFVSVWLDQR